MRPLSLALLSGAALIAPAAAHAGSITVTVPRVTIAEYKKPYVAGWIEPVGGGAAARTLFVWYGQKTGGNEPGTRWLSELRSWWRKAGRTAKLPADGVSGATRAPGSYTIPLPAGLTPGNYVVSIEAAREHGGRELVSVPIKVPAAGNARAMGKAELGAVTVSAK
jgi:hypothetical protein